MPVNIVITWKILWYSLAVAASVIGTIIGATSYTTWEVRKDYIEDLKNQVSVYNQAESWKLPETLKSLNIISDKLQSQLSASEEIKKLKHNIAVYESTEAKSKSMLSEANANVKKLEGQISTLEYNLRKSLAEQTQFTLKEGQAAELVKNRIIFGMSGIGPGYILANVNNDPVNIRIAGSTSITVDNELCTITLMQTHYPSATISFSCTKPA